jgi:hypothetical protein
MVNPDGTESDVYLERVIETGQPFKMFGGGTYVRDSTGALRRLPDGED